MAPDTNSSVKAKSIPGKWYLFYATWEEWGRASRDCESWGLCHFYSCWACFVPDYTKKYSGLVKIDLDTKQGFLFVELSSSDTIQRDALQNKSVFYIDQDITSNNITLLKGEYIFDSTVGKEGGYKVSVTIE